MGQRRFYCKTPGHGWCSQQEPLFDSCLEQRNTWVSRCSRVAGAANVVM
jgi:hypothetical protein